MKLVQNIQDKFQGLIQASKRYPLTVLFLVVIAGLNTYLIQQETDDYINYVYSLIVGVFLSAVAQHIYERFFEKTSQRIALMGGSLLLTLLYFYTIGSSTVYDLEMTVKTSIIFLILAVAFIWVPTIKNRITFSESYLSAFKAFFTTVLLLPRVMRTLRTVPPLMPASPSFCSIPLRNLSTSITPGVTFRSTQKPKASLRPK